MQARQIWRFVVFHASFFAVIDSLSSIVFSLLFVYNNINNNNNNNNNNLY